MTALSPGERVLLRIFLGEGDRHEGKPLWEAILLRLREEGFAGATVLRGIAGFGRTSVYDRRSFLRLSQDLPVVVEAVEEEEKIRSLLPWLSSVMQGGIITLERARVVFVRGREAE